jgi:hypothetical protein
VKGEVVRTAKEDNKEEGRVRIFILYTIDTENGNSSKSICKIRSWLGAS